MLIDVHELEGQSRHLEFRFSDFDTQDEDIRCTEQPFVSFDLSRRLNEVRITGRLVASFEALCDRCLAPVLCAFDETVDLLYVPRPLGQTLEEEKELREKDLNYASYEGDSIDLGEVVREQILLVMPPKILCKEECRGLCQRCGANLNLTSCSCNLLDTDPRWDALSEFKPGGAES